MPWLDHPFFFDVNYGLGDESVFCNVEDVGDGVNPPPPEGYFLILDNNTPFLLLNGQNMDLL